MTWTRLPQKRKRPKMGVRELPWWRSEPYKKYVRGFACIVPDCPAYRRQACHVRTGTDGCKGEKPSDFFCYSGCAIHHEEQHRIGERAFEEKYGVNLLEWASRVARGSRFHREIEEWKRTHNTRNTTRAA